MGRFSDPSRVLQHLALLAVGAVIGAGATAGIFIAVDDDASGPSTGEPVAEPNDDTTDVTEPAIDPTDTDFGELTEEAEAAGVRVQWTSELLTEGGGEADFVTAHQEGIVAFIADDLRVVDSGAEADTVRLCENDACREVTADDARAALPGAMQPFFDVIRSVPVTVASPDYRITGETELESGIFEQCGQYDPEAFGLVVPDSTVSITQCIDASRNIPLRIGLQGETQSLGGAAFTALADATTADFTAG